MAVRTYERKDEVTTDEKEQTEGLNQPTNNVNETTKTNCREASQTTATVQPCS